MSKKRLLKRIRCFGENEGKRIIDDEDKSSISDHVNKLLNIKKGNLITDKDCGMPDFTEFVYNYPECLRDIKKSAADIITKYEPRLKDIKVDFLSKDENDFTLHFQLTGITANNKNLVIVDSMIDKNGNIRTKT